MLPGPLAPIEPKARALTTIYAPRKRKTRQNKTAQSRMLDDVPVKHTLSPFHPLPAIGQRKPEKETKVIVLDLNKNETLRERPSRVQEILKPITPMRIHGYHRQNTIVLSDLDEKKHLVRENTYDVIKPIFLKTPKVKERDSLSDQHTSPDKNSDESFSVKPKQSPKSRFKKAAYEVVKLSALPETGKLLSLRERETFKISGIEEEKSSCKLQNLTRSPTRRTNDLSQIFQCLEMKERHREKLKKENSWF